MSVNKKEHVPSYISALLTNKCPRCRKGYIFINHNAWGKGFLKMPERCAVCDQLMEIETGFYYGTGYVSYALTVALSVASFVAWAVLIGFSLNDNRLFWWLGTNAMLLIALQPWLMRLSRVIWLSFFVRYNKRWATEPPVKRER